MNKFIYAFSFLLLTTTTSMAQQHRYALKIGLHAGLSNYYGDLSHQVWDLPHQFKQPIQDFNFLSYGLSVEYHISRTFGLRLWGMKSQFKASDRTYEQNDRYNRALNVQTDLFDASLLGIVYFDNDMVLRSRAIIAPYFMFGGGLTHFETKGDLLSADNNPYHYWSDNSIRSEAETGLNAATAPIIEQDYKYETALRSLNTEGANYSPITWNVALGLGVKFRLSSRFHLHLEALVRYTGSDYLDDVSGNYRSSYNDNFQAYAANPSNANRSTRGESPEMNDWYTFVGLSAHYSFGQKTYKIRPAIIYTKDLLSNNNTLKTATTPTQQKNNTATQVPTNTTGSDTLVQKIITTTTTIKTVTVDTFNNSSSSIDSETMNTELLKLEPPTEEIVEVATNNLAEDSIPTLVNIPTTLDKTAPIPLAVDTIAQTEVDTMLNDSINTLVNTPNTIDKTTPIPLTVDSIVEEKDSATIVNTTLNRSEENVVSNDSIFIQNKIITSPNPDQARTLELQEQKYQYEMLLQKERYERQLAELKLQKDLEQERKKSAPNTKEQELQYQLKLEQQKLANELEKQKLLNQLEIEKNRPAPDTKQEALKLQQQKYEAELKLQQQEYEYKLQIQALQNQLNIEQLKKVNEGTGVINTPAPSNQPINQDADRSTNPIEEPNTISNSTESRQADLIRMQLEQQELLLKIRTLEAAAAQSTSTATGSSTDTIKIVQRDSIFVGNDNNEVLTEKLNQQQRSNSSLTTKLAAATQKSLEQQQEIDRLQQEIAKIESEKKRVASKLDVFLTQKKGTYVTKIYFDVSKSSLTVQAKETLTTLVYYLEKYPTVQFWVKGFASKTGRTEVNERLSAERAMEVADFLKQSGIQGERIRTTPLGEQDSNSNNELDRRAEVHLSF